MRVRLCASVPVPTLLNHVVFHYSSTYKRWALLGLIQGNTCASNGLHDGPQEDRKSPLDGVPRPCSTSMQPKGPARTPLGRNYDIQYIMQAADQCTRKSQDRTSKGSLPLYNFWSLAHHLVRVLALFPVSFPRFGMPTRELFKLGQPEELRRDH